MREIETKEKEVETDIQKEVLREWEWNVMKVKRERERDETTSIKNYGLLFSQKIDRKLNKFWYIVMADDYQVSWEQNAIFYYDP